MKLNNDGELADILNEFDQFMKQPEAFVKAKENVVVEIKQFLKRTYDVTKNEEQNSSKSNILPKLIIHSFDEEQIFQQIELQNDVLLNNCISKVSKLAVAKDRLIFNELESDNEEHSDSEGSKDSGTENTDIEVTQHDSDQEIDNYDTEMEEGGGDEEINDLTKNKRKIKSAIDDQFFKLNEMNDFLLSQEKTKSNLPKNESESEDDDIDMFGTSENEEENDIEGNDKLKNPRYKDFFGKKSMRDNLNDIVDNVDDKEYMDTVKSSLELREERLKTKIDEIENTAVSEKPWQLKGEVTADNRPLNSLLEEVLEFDLTTRPAPVITEETTFILEDVIKQRIKDKAFDDVQRKQKPTETPLEFKKKLILDQEKSKESLAQIYEKEYIKQTQALNDQTEKDEIEPNLHKEIKKIMHGLFAKLDSLSNFHFTPKPIAPELRVVNNLPAITMEEVAPVVSSDATLLAPEEVQSKVKGDIIGKGERTKTDKKRERRKKKQKQKTHAEKSNAINKLRSGLGNKYSKEKAKKMLDIVTKDVNVDKMNHLYNKKIKSSSAFFTQLQENVTSQIKMQTKNKIKNTNKNIKHFKL